MNIIKGVLSFIKAIKNAPDMQHWIKKYEAAKKDNDDLRKEIEFLGNMKRLELRYRYN